MGKLPRLGFWLSHLFLRQKCQAMVQRRETWAKLRFLLSQQTQESQKAKVAKFTGQDAKEQGCHKKQKTQQRTPKISKGFLSVLISALCKETMKIQWGYKLKKTNTGFKRLFSKAHMARLIMDSHQKVWKAAQYSSHQVKYLQRHSLDSKVKVTSILIPSNKT